MDQAERGELGTLKNVLTRLSLPVLKAGLSDPPSALHVPPPNQIKTQCSSLSVATIMSMSVSNFDGSGCSNRGASPALGYSYGSWVMRCNPEGCIATQTHTHCTALHYIISTMFCCYSSTDMTCNTIKYSYTITQK